MSLFKKPLFSPEHVQTLEREAALHYARGEYVAAHREWVEAAQGWLALANRERYRRQTHLARSERAWEQAASSASRVAQGVARLWQEESKLSQSPA